MNRADFPLIVLAAVVVACLTWPARPMTPVIGRLDPAERRAGLSGRRHGRRGREHRVARDDVADLLALLAAPLRAGVPPAVAVGAALSAAGPVHPSLDDLVSQLRRRALAGETLAGVWLTQGAELGSADLGWVGQAWLLTERIGAPLAPALSEAERVLRSRARAEARLQAAAAGPRASMAVLSLLPLGGPVVGAAFGLGPAALYLASPLCLASGVVGLTLAALGWWWGRRILAGALAPARPRPVHGGQMRGPWGAWTTAPPRSSHSRDR